MSNTAYDSYYEPNAQTCPMRNFIHFDVSMKHKRPIFHLPKGPNPPITYSFQLNPKNLHQRPSEVAVSPLLSHQALNQNLSLSAAMLSAPPHSSQVTRKSFFLTCKVKVTYLRNEFSNRLEQYL